MIAHAAGLPLEETIAQLAPLVAGAAVAVGLLIERARASVRRFDRGSGNRMRTHADERKEA